LSQTPYMFKPFALLLTATMFCSTLIYSQANYEKGTIVLKNGQPIEGFINYQNWEINPKVINFKTSDQTTSTDYSVNDLKSFDVTGKDRYESFIVTKMIAPIDILKVDKNTVYSTVSDTVFLRVLLLGNNLDLYELFDERVHFYIKQPEAAPVELQYKVTSRNATSVVRHTIYRDQLKVLTEDNTLKSVIENAEYEPKAIFRIVKRMNTSVWYQAPDMITSKGSAKLFVGAGLAIHSLDVDGLNTTLTNMAFSSPASYIITTGLDLLGARNFSNFRMRLELSFYPASYQGTTTEPGFFVGQTEKKDYSIKTTNIVPGFSAMYTPYHTKKLSAFVGAASAMCFTKYTDNTLTTTNLTTGNVDRKPNYLALSTSWITADVRAGVRTKNIELLVTSKVVGSFFNFDYIFGNVRMYTFRVLYSL
jgi:hypothetical protein